MTSTNSQLGQWLFNPFRFIAGGHALLLGLGILLASGVIGWLGKTHFDGVIDVHSGLEAPLWCFLVEGLINWICMAVPLFFFGLIVSSSSFRIIDVLGTQALARWPYLITALVMLPDANRRFSEYIMSKLTPAAQTPAISYADLAIFAFALMVAVFMAVWMVALMYRAYCLSCNIKGTKAIITFILSLIGAEVLSRFAIIRLIT
ncbi:MAG TPA: hypothetical protein VMW16_05945 [Sedimentisphaerales bacterium]|nr:hypothetical protein [Sedimentisphaerales bacterium]